jgi:hypothetical protein
MKIISKYVVRRSGIFAVAMATMTITGCSSNAATCEEPQFYESATGGKRIEAPEDLSELQGFKEMVIPEASPRPEREPGSGCLDRPPTLRIEE